MSVHLIIYTFGNIQVILCEAFIYAHLM